MTNYRVESEPTVSKKCKRGLILCAIIYVLRISEVDAPALSKSYACEKVLIPIVRLSVAL